MEDGFGSRVKAVSTIEVTRTYLELRSASELNPARSNDPRLRIGQRVRQQVVAGPGEPGDRLTEAELRRLGA